MKRMLQIASNYHNNSFRDVYYVPPPPKKKKRIALNIHEAFFDVIVQLLLFFSLNNPMFLFVD